MDSKTVSASGFYVANFKAPNQVDGKGVVSDWEVTLMQVDTNSAMLVVRGLWSERFKEPQLAMSNRIELTGILRAHQNEDRALNSPGVISRLDSSVIVGLTDLDLYDGYVIAVDEKFRDGDISRTRVTPEMRTARIPGFYWQHISYVVIWWLMAAVVLYLPIYRRRVVD
jgi:cytochrome oxidase assembly protein ShyY1